jgi:hypothetical protein
MEKMLRACLNWKVIGGLAAVGLGIWFIAPNALVAALPFLLIAVCPLSMMFMMRGMGDHHASEPGNDGPGTRVAPSRDVQIAGLKAEREAVDRRIAELEDRAEAANVRETPGGGAQIQP